MKIKQSGVIGGWGRSSIQPGGFSQKVTSHAEIEGRACQGEGTALQEPRDWTEMACQRKKPFQCGQSSGAWGGGREGASSNEKPLETEITCSAFFCLFICLAAFGLSCSTRDLRCVTVGSFLAAHGLPRCPSSAW